MLGYAGCLNCCVELGLARTQDPVDEQMQCSMIMDDLQWQNPGNLQP